MRECCEVCGGSRKISLRVMRGSEMLAPAMRPSDDAVSIVDSSRNYPCPECSPDVAPFERVNAVNEQVLVAERHKDRPEYMDHVHGALANAIARHLLRAGMIRFREGESQQFGCITVQGTVGVVAPRMVAKFEDRVRERQFEVADAAIEEAIAKVHNWGSHYGAPSVQKEQAAHLLREALKTVKAKA